MFLSVILPIYNVEKYLIQCLNSVLKQNFDDYEIILVDDGSNDSSPKICDKYANEHKNVKVIHKKNGGQSSARNAGLMVAKGDYIFFLDSDDYLLNNDFFLRIFSLANLNPDFIVFKHIRYFENQKKYSECNYDFRMNYTEFSDIVKELVKKDAFFGMAWIKIIKKSILLDNNICFIEGLTGEDMPWNLELYLNSKSIYLMDSVEYVYRQRNNSITTTPNLKNLTDFINILEKNFPIVLKANCDTKLKDALLGALAKYYSNLLITYVRVGDAEKKKYLTNIKRLSVLLNYSLSSRPYKVRKIYKIFGIKITLMLLKILDRKKR